jgi:uncharacterized protein (DUF169 family)
MKSIIAEKLKPDYGPVAILWSNTKPAGALQIKPQGQTCIMPFFAQVATRGKTAVFDRESYGCPGARAGLGFGNGYYDAFGGAGIDFMAAFFVKGKESSKNPDAYCATVLHIPERERAKFIHGERLHRNTDKAKKFMTRDLPITDIDEKYVIFKPLSMVKPGEHPVVVIFVADPLQISGLVTLVSAIRKGTDAVRVPPWLPASRLGHLRTMRREKNTPVQCWDIPIWQHGQMWENPFPTPCLRLQSPGNCSGRWRTRQRTAYSTARSGKGWQEKGNVIP